MTRHWSGAPPENEKGPACAGPSTLTLTLRYSRLRRAAQILVGRRGLFAEAVELGADAMRDLAHGERDLRTRQAEIGQFAVAHAQKLGLGGAQLEVRLDPVDEAAPLAADPQDRVAETVGEQLGAGVAGAHLEQAAVVERQVDLGVSPRRRSFAGQILKGPNRLGPTGRLLQLCTAVHKCCDAQKQYRPKS